MLTSSLILWENKAGFRRKSHQVRDMTAFSKHFFIVHHIKITIHLPYCNHKLVYDNNTKINYTLEDYVIFL